MKTDCDEFKKKKIIKCLQRPTLVSPKFVDDKAPKKVDFSAEQQYLTKK